MKLVKYKVSIPISETDYKEIIFYTLDDVCNFFDISKSCVYKIIQGKYLFSNKNTKHLSGLKIIKEDIPDDKKEELKKSICLRRKNLQKQ
jgi:hypothetical protein